MPKLNAKFFIPLVAAGFIAIWWMNRARFVEVKINGTIIETEIAETEIEKRNGLMHRETLGENAGMLFAYEAPVPAYFWMKNTLIPLDMIFIRPDKTISYIEKEAAPCPPEVETCPNYTSHEITQYVLEVNGGFSELNGINVGDVVEFELHPTLQKIEEKWRRKTLKKGVILEMEESSTPTTEPR